MRDRGPAPDEARRDGDRDVHEPGIGKELCEGNGDGGDEARYGDTGDDVDPKEFAELLVRNALLLDGRRREPNVLELFRNSREGRHHTDKAKISRQQDPRENGDRANANNGVDYLKAHGDNAAAEGLRFEILRSRVYVDGVDAVRLQSCPSLALGPYGEFVNVGIIAILFAGYRPTPRRPGGAVRPRKALAEVQRWLPAEDFAHALVRVTEGLEPRLEAAGDEDVRQLRVAREDGCVGQADEDGGQPVRNRDADPALADAAEIRAQVRPDPFAHAVDDVERLAHGTRIRSRHGEQVGAVFDMSEGTARQRADDEMEPAHSLTEGGHIAMVTAPDEARPEHRQVPAVLLREAAGDALLPPFGDRVAVALVEIRNGLDGRALVEGAAAGAPVVDREAARQDHPPARSASHGVEQALGSDHGASELQVLAARHHRRQVHQHISAVEDALVGT